MFEKESLRAKIGDYLVDVSKLIFGGVVLSTILNIQSVPKGSILIAGGLATIIFAVLGFYLIKEK